MTTTPRQTISFNLEKETPGTFVYKQAAPADEAIIPSLYIKKRAFDASPPKKLSVTVDW